MLVMHSEVSWSGGGGGAVMYSEVSYPEAYRTICVKYHGPSFSYKVRNLGMQQLMVMQTTHGYIKLASGDGSVETESCRHQFPMDILNDKLYHICAKWKCLQADC